MLSTRSLCHRLSHSLRYSQHVLDWMGGMHKQNHELHKDYILGLWAHAFGLIPQLPPWNSARQYYQSKCTYNTTKYTYMRILREKKLESKQWPCILFTYRDGDNLIKITNNAKLRIHRAKRLCTEDCSMVTWRSQIQGRGYV